MVASGVYKVLVVMIKKGLEGECACVDSQNEHSEHSVKLGRGTTVSKVLESTVEQVGKHMVKRAGLCCECENCEWIHELWFAIHGFIKDRI